jgi:hypothetical protein
MSDDISDIAAYYNNDTEREHTRLERHQLEYDLRNVCLHLSENLLLQISLLGKRIA